VRKLWIRAVAEPLLPTEAATIHHKPKLALHKDDSEPALVIPPNALAAFKIKCSVTGKRGETKKAA
jgi:hypothetical protein